MNNINFKRPWFKWALVLGLVLLMAFNIYNLKQGNYLAVLWILFQLVLLTMIFTGHKWTKSLIEGISFLYAILNAFNLILLGIPLILHLAEPSEDFDQRLYLDLALTAVKLILSILTYRLSKKYIEPVPTKTD